jgi:hypothetical protein
MKKLMVYIGRGPTGKIPFSLWAYLPLVTNLDINILIDLLFPHIRLFMYHVCVSAVRSIFIIIIRLQFNY